MANRRITELPSILGADLGEQDLLTLVRVFEVDPTLKNKKITLEEFSNYLNIKYLTLSGGVLTGPLALQDDLTVAGDTQLNTITATGTSNFNNVFVDSDLTVTGVVSGTFITGDTANFTIVTGSTATFTSQISGSFISGNTGNFTSLTGISGVFTSSLSGATITGNTGQFTNLTGVTGTFTNQVSGATVTGDVVLATNVTGITGVFTSQLSGTTITGSTVSATSGTFGTLVTSGHVVQDDLTVSGNLFVLGSGYFSSDVVISGTLSGATITGTTAAFSSGIYQQLSGAVISGNIGSFTELSGISGVFTSQVSGATITGNVGQFATVTGGSAGFTSITGTTVSGGSAGFNNGVFTTQVSGATVVGISGVFDDLIATGGTFSSLTGTFISGDTITGDVIQGASGTFDFLAANNLAFTSATISGDLFVLGSGYFSSGLNVTGVISGETVTGSAGLFTNITGSTLHVTTPSGGIPAIICSGVISGDTSGLVIQGPLVILP